MSRRALAGRALAAAAVALTLSAGAAAPAGARGSPPAGPGHAVPKTTLAAIEPQFMCVTCGIPLVVAESPAADQERQYLQSRIATGESVAAIKRDMVAQFGTAVLALPPDHGFNVAFYLVPIAVVLLGAGLVAFLTARWRRNRRRAERDVPASTAQAGPSATDLARLDADLTRFDG